MKLIVGLGNPGDAYARTRHNAGFRALDELAKKYEAHTWEQSKKFNALVSEIKIGKETIRLAKPQTFMNASGEAVKKMASFWRVPMENILVIYDDLDLCLGQLRLREGGRSGGHRGVMSICAELGTEDVPRLKIGIAGSASGKQSVPSEKYVLKPFTKPEAKKLESVLEQVPEMIKMWLAGEKTRTVTI